MTDNYYKASDQILTVDHRFKPRGRDWEDSITFTYIFDFEFRTLTVSRYQANTFTNDTHPFSAVDEDVLARMRDKLIEMGGKPDPVSGPREGGKKMLAKPAQGKGLNL